MFYLDKKTKKIKKLKKKNDKTLILRKLKERQEMNQTERLLGSLIFLNIF